jgi:tRNA(adenine34) deaminase
VDASVASASGDPDDRLMRLALEEARAAAAGGDVPVGAVVARGDEVVARAGNAREREQDPTAHAEILALRQAAQAAGSWHLEGCMLYVTLEPCAMCAGALVLARIDRLVLGAADPKGGFAGSLGDIVRDGRLNHEVEVTVGVLAEECGEVLRAFFADRR